MGRHKAAKNTTSVVPFAVQPLIFFKILKSDLRIFYKAHEII